MRNEEIAIENYSARVGCLSFDKVEGFKDGYRQCEKDILANSKLGFSDWVSQFEFGWMLVKPGVASYYRALSQEAYQAGSMKNMKELVDMKHDMESLIQQYGCETDDIVKILKSKWGLK